MPETRYESESLVKDLKNFVLVMKKCEVKSVRAHVKTGCMREWWYQKWRLDRKPRCMRVKKRVKLDVMDMIIMYTASVMWSSWTKWGLKSRSVGLVREESEWWRCLKGFALVWSCWMLDKGAAVKHSVGVWGGAKRENDKPRLRWCDEKKRATPSRFCWNMQRWDAW